MQTLPTVTEKVPNFSLLARKMPRSQPREKHYTDFSGFFVGRSSSSNLSDFGESCFAAEASNCLPTFAAAVSDSVESDKHILDILEPTPFRESAYLKASSLSNKIFIVTFTTDVESLPLQTPHQPDLLDRSLPMNAARDQKTEENPEENASSLTAFMKQSRKRSASTFCCAPTTKRVKHDPSSADQANMKINMASFCKDAESKIFQFLPHHESRWDEQYAALLKFKDKHGHCRVPHSYKDDLSLSQWSKRQRYHYKLKLQNQPSAMSADRQKKLEAVGFILDPQTSGWETRRKELAEYKKRFGNCNVPARYPKLGSWVKRQRRQYRLFKLGKLPRMQNDRFMSLKELGFQFEIRATGFQRDRPTPSSCT